MGIRFRGSIIGNDPTPTSGGASGIYDLDAYTTYTSVSLWPAAVGGLYRIPRLPFFAQGQRYYSASNSYVGDSCITYLNENGIVTSDVGTLAGVGCHAYAAGAGYGLDKALTYGGRSGQISNSQVVYVSNTGVLATDTNGLITYQSEKHGGATYGLKNALFIGGIYVYAANSWIINKRILRYISDTGVVSNINNALTIGGGQVSTGYGNGTVISYGSDGLTYITDTGTVASVSAMPSGHVYSYDCATRIGSGKAIMIVGGASYGAGTTSYTAMVSDTGVLASDQAISISASWSGPSAASLPNGSVIVSYGQYNDSNNIRPTAFITNTGVFGSVSTVTEPTTQSRTAAGYGS